MPFEKSIQPILSTKRYAVRQARYFLYAMSILAISLMIGTGGYAFFGHLSIIDGFYNASMILTGMGPVSPITSNLGKIFASLYALYSGVAFLTTVAVLLAPAIHRLLHLFHIDSSG